MFSPNYVNSFVLPVFSETVRLFFCCPWRSHYAPESKRLKCCSSHFFSLRWIPKKGVALWRNQGAGHGKRYFWCAREQCWSDVTPSERFLCPLTTSFYVWYFYFCLH